MSSRGQHHKEVQTPTNDVTTSFRSFKGALASPAAATVAKVRNLTYRSDGGHMVHNTKLKINMDAVSGKRLKRDKLPAEFLFNMEMALRVAFGVLIASAIQTRDSDYDPKYEHTKHWVLFPDWYYLGGLSYCAVAVIFSAKANAGATIREMCQAFMGVGMALIYNMVLFSCYTLRTSESATVPSDGFYQITRTFSSSAYWVNLHNFYVILPFIMLFTIAMLLLPFEANTRKFAMGNNLFFALTILNPSNPLNSKKLKAMGDPYFETQNILKNLQMYFLVGFVGTCISVFIMFVPYPVFAIKKLREETYKGAEDILDLLNLIVDSYCFKNKSMDQMKFLKVILHRKFEATEARHLRMGELVKDVWWEQLFGFHYLLKFNLSMYKNKVNLLESLTSDLRSLNHAMQLEQYEDLHHKYMKVLQREIYVIQVRSGDLLSEIADEVHNSTKHLELKALKPLETQMEKTLHKYRAIQSRTMQAKQVSVQDVAGNVPLNLFLFSLNSFCATMIKFETTHNLKSYDSDAKRAKSFLEMTVVKFYKDIKYDRSKFLEAFKASIAICVGTIIAVYVYAYSSTTPSAVAFVMGNHMGGSFSITVNRVGGVVAGSVVPSVFQFFISQICHPLYVNVILTNFALFVWVAISMYFRFAGGYGNYAGLVSAFISAGIFLKQSDACLPGGSDSFGSIAISSYSSLAQTSVGIILFVLVELALCPESAATVLRRKVQDSLKLLEQSFALLFGHHLDSSDVISEEKLVSLREILEKDVPKLLEEQVKLLAEASAEPTMWRAAFSTHKYEHVINSQRRLLNNISLLFKLVEWFNFRVKHNNVNMMDTADIRVDDDDNAYNDGDTVSYNNWAAATKEFQSSVADTFATLNTLFSNDFIYAEPEQTAVFMQIKEAFRLADKDCSGEIDAAEVHMMLEAIFSQSGKMKEDDIRNYVAEFMSIVDKDQSGKVSFEEFMEALENGLKLEVEVYSLRKTKKSSSKKLERDGTELRSTLLKIDETNGEATALSNSDNTVTMVDDAAIENGGKDVIEEHHTMNVTAKLSSHRGDVMVRTFSAGSMFNSGAFAPLSPMRRQHDVLSVENFSLAEIAANMKAAYVQWLMQDRRYERVSMEELLLLNCLVSGAEGIARNLSALEEIVVSS
ncbi:Transmembrane protein [Globisporangium polare]